VSELPAVAILHYSLPPVVGGVESVIQAQARAFLQAGYPLTLVGGTGQHGALPRQSEMVLIPELSGLHPEIAQISRALAGGRVPETFAPMTGRLVDVLRPVLGRFEHVIIHNVLTKHFNLPLTAALERLAENGGIRHTLAWCHDFSWTSASSREKLHPGFPWDLLRTPLKDVTYVTVSGRRRRELADLLGLDPESIRLAYNGVEPRTLLGLSDKGLGLAERLGLMDSDLVLLMPVRVTRAKNIEYALDVLAALKKLCRNPRLVLTGPPDPHDPESMRYFQSLRALRDRLGVTTEACFVFESGPKPGEPFIIPETLVGELYRVSDVVFMPSHREGFGMPVLEAALSGLPVVSTNVPASAEIGRQDVSTFTSETPAGELAAQILSLVADNSISRFRRRVRQNYTWQALFHRSIEPLLVAEKRPA
jgi:glycosyltransferase involved in cell wall biosynthesis